MSPTEGEGGPAATPGFLVLTAAGPLMDAAIVPVAGLATGPARRLSPTAAELPALAEALAPARATLSGAAIDVNWVSAAHRRKRLLIADMDKTMITVECVDELADFAGVKPQVAAITERAMRGDLDFEAALKARVGLLAGLPETTLQECFDRRVRLSPGAAETVGAMAAAGAVTALVSGGFTFFTERVAAAAGFSQHRANTLLAEDGRLTGAVGEPILGREAKAAALAELLAANGLRTEDALAVGDGANDLAMIDAAGLGVAYRAKPAVAEAADAAINHADLRALLYLQGIGDGEAA